MKSWYSFHAVAIVLTSHLALTVSLLYKTQFERGSSFWNIYHSEIGASYNFWDEMLKLGPEINFFSWTKSTIEPRSNRVEIGGEDLKKNLFERFFLVIQFKSFSLSKIVGCPHFCVVVFSELGSPDRILQNLAITCWTLQWFYNFVKTVLQFTRIKLQFVSCPEI